MAVQDLVPHFFDHQFRRINFPTLQQAAVALIASMHKLVFIIFAVLRDQKPFELKTPEQHAVEQGFVKAA